MTDFTKNELRAMPPTIIAYEVSGHTTFTRVIDLAAFALAQVERAEAAEAALEREKRARDEDVEVMECYRDAVLSCAHEPDVIAFHLGEVNARLAAHKDDRDA